MDGLETLVPLGAAIIGLLGGVLTMRIQNRGRPENAFIDQLQEELKELRGRDRIYLPYIFYLHHIIERLGGTAPPLPKIVKDYLDRKEEG